MSGTEDSEYDCFLDWPYRNGEVKKLAVRLTIDYAKATLI
jgi:hypothetical protein